MAKVITTYNQVTNDSATWLDKINQMATFDKVLLGLFAFTVLVVVAFIFWHIRRIERGKK